MANAQLEAVERLARDANGTLIHPHLLRCHAGRAAAGRASRGRTRRRPAIASRFDVIIGAVAAGREELVRLHRAHRIDDTLRSVELDLHPEELGAISAKVWGPGRAPLHERATKACRTLHGHQRRFNACSSPTVRRARVWYAGSVPDDAHHKPDGCRDDG